MFQENIFAVQRFFFHKYEQKENSLKTELEFFVLFCVLCKYCTKSRAKHTKKINCEKHGSIN